jgi:hypothetical protein
MNRRISRLWIAVVAAILALPGWGCSDVGDSSAIPGQGDDAAADTSLSSPDATVSTDGQATSGNDASDAGSNDVAAQDVTGEPDTGSSETGGPEASFEDVGAPDTGSQEDTGAPDTGSQEDTGTPDTGSQEDTGAADTGSQEDTGAPDTGVADTGVDATLADGGADAEETGTAHDAGADATLGDSGGEDAGDTGAPDTGVADSGVDAAQGDGGLVPCTAAGQTGCVECVGNTNTRCTPTEALVVQYDIDKGTAHAPGADPAGSCYDCLVQSGCLDDSTGDVQHECEDSAIMHGTASQCADVITCIFASGNASTPEGYTSGNCSSRSTNVCYCGTAPVLGTCGGSASAANGNCADVIAAGAGFPVSDGTDILDTFAVTTYASGMAEQIFKCAVSSQCTVCLQ